MAIFGVIAVSVATYSTSSCSDAPLLNHIVESSYSMRQFVFLMPAPFVVAFIVQRIPYDWLRRRAALIYYGGTALLVIVLFASQACGVQRVDGYHLGLHHSALGVCEAVHDL